MPIRRGRSFCLRIAPVLTLLFPPHCLAAEKPAPMKQEAERAKQQPFRVDVSALEQGRKPGETVQLLVLLRDGQNQPVRASKDTLIELDIVSPSGKALTQTVRIPAGEASKQVSMTADEPGLTKLRARHASQELLEGTNYMLIIDPRYRSRGIRERPKPPGPKSSLRRSPPWFQTAAWAQEEADAAPPPRPPAAAEEGTLLLAVSGENDAEVRADGKSSARITVYFQDDRPAQSSIDVWLRWTNGNVDRNPIRIERGAIHGEALWTSRTPVEATVSIAGSFPKHPVDGSSSATVKFVEPILGIAFVNPPPRLTLVDSVALTARFFGPDGHPIETSKARKFSFASDNPGLRISPRNAEVAPGSFEFAATLLPSALGTSSIEASTPGYAPAKHTVTVTGWLVIALCLLGGLLGSLAAYVNDQGSLWGRLLTGVVVAGVASWAYVYVGLARTDAAIAHNQISVLFVSLLAAFTGIKALRTATKALGIGF